jgi:hypothetical protein
MGAIMIRCPQSGRAIPTGLEMDTAEFQRSPVSFPGFVVRPAPVSTKGSPRTPGCPTARTTIPALQETSRQSVGRGPERISAPDGFCRGEGGTPPGAGVTTWWPRLLGQRDCGSLVPA